MNETLWLLCEETTGTTADDASASENDCELSNNTFVQVTTTGVVGNGFYLDATQNEYLTPDTQISLGTNWSAAWWSNLVSIGANRPIFGSNAAGTGYAVYLSAGTMRVECDTNNNYVDFSIGDLSGADHHFVITKEGTSVKLYVDSVLDSTQTLPGSGDDTLTIDLIGRGFSTNEYYGMLDDCRLCNGSVLTQDLVDALYNSGAGTADSLAQLMGGNPHYYYDMIAESS